MRVQKAHSVIAIIGYILSPLSWWNDLYVNVPLAYLFSIPFTLINESLFTVSFVLGYWLSNLLGLIMLQWGGLKLLGFNKKLSWRDTLLSSLIYSLLLLGLIQVGWLPSPHEVIQLIK